MPEVATYNHIYIIVYAPGAAGSFIAALMTTFYGNSSSASFSKYGNSHAAADFKNNIVRFRPYDEDKFGMRTRPFNPSKPHIVLDHGTIDFVELRAKYPNAKIIIIQYTPEDVLLIQANFYFKWQTDAFGMDPNTLEIWKILSSRFFNNAPTPHDESITKEMIMAYLESHASPNIIHIIQPKYKSGTRFADPNFFYLEFNDIMCDRDKTLSAVSEMTGLPTNPDAEKFYDDYIAAQKPIWDFLGYPSI